MACSEIWRLTFPEFVGWLQVLEELKLTNQVYLFLGSFTEKQTLRDLNFLDMWTRMQTAAFAERFLNWNLTTGSLSERFSDGAPRKFRKLEIWSRGKFCFKIELRKLSEEINSFWTQAARRTQQILMLMLESVFFYALEQACCLFKICLPNLVQFWYQINIFFNKVLIIWR